LNNYIKELDDKIENLRDLLDQSRSNEDDLKLTIDKLNANIIDLNDLYMMSENENDSNKKKINQLDSNLKNFINQSTCQSIIETLISAIEKKAIIDSNAANIENLQGQFNSKHANKQNELSMLNDLNNKLKKKTGK
jgi:phage shock protein A